VLIIVAVLMPRGLVGLYRDALTRWWPRTPALPPMTDVLAVLGLRPRAAVPGETRTRPSLEPLPSAGRPRHRRASRAAGADRADRADTTSAGTAALTVRDARRHFGGVAAIDGVDLVVERGKIHALIGPNGSGKTTLLNLITGFYSLDAGAIHLGTTRLDTKRGPVPVARLGVARTFQTPKLSPLDTVVANVLNGADQRSRGALFATLLHTRRARAEDRLAMGTAYAVLDDVGLYPRSADPVGNVPHGTLRLVEISRAVAADPLFVLLDEPAAGLSLGEAEQLKDAIRRIAGAGLGVLIVEHNLPVVFDIADVVTVLHEGKVISTGSPAAVSSDPEVVRVYIGRRQRGPARTPTL
jgi:ABC-type branched-subunit amino acid transport system ATPase component